MAYRRTEAAGSRKAPRHEVAGCWAVIGSERYGDLAAADGASVSGCGGAAAILIIGVGIGALGEGAVWIGGSARRVVWRCLARARRMGSAAADELAGAPSAFRRDG